MKRIELSVLEKLDYESGEKLLLDSGYIQNESAECEGIDCDYILDAYFTLFDEDDEEVDTKSFVQKFNKNSNESNDDKSDDFLLSQSWQDVGN